MIQLYSDSVQSIRHCTAISQNIEGVNCNLGSLKNK